MSKGLLRSGITAAFDQDLWQALQITPGTPFEIDNCLRPALITGIKKTGQGTPGTPAVISAEKDEAGNIVLLVKVTNKSALFPKLNEVLNPDGNKSFTMSNKLLAWRYTAPTPAGPFDGAFEIEATGGFRGNLVHVHQHTGNPGATRLVDIEAEDPDVCLLRLTHAVANAICLEIPGALTIDKEGDLTTIGDLAGAEVKANKRLKYTIKRDIITGAVQWKNLPGVGRMVMSGGVTATTPTTAAGVNAVGPNQAYVYAYITGPGAGGDARNYQYMGGNAITQSTSFSFSGGTTIVMSTAIPAQEAAIKTGGATGAWQNKFNLVFTTGTASISYMVGYLTKTAQRDERTELFLTGGA